LAAVPLLLAILMPHGSVLVGIVAGALAMWATAAIGHLAEAAL